MNIRRLIWPAAGLLAVGAVLAQSITLEIGSSESLGDFLTTQDGRSVYATLEDEGGEIGCLEDCLTYWPIVESDDPALAGEGLDPELIDIIERPDGSAQVAYAGFPLYYFQYDTTPGATRGQASTGTWFLVSPAGDLVGYEPVVEEAEDAAEAADEAVGEAHALADKMAVGEEVYQRICATCHSAGGEGGLGVRLIGSARLADTHEITDAITYGRAYMPALGEQLTAEETAAVLTFIRNSWGNSFGDVPLELVEEVREGLPE